MSNKQNVWIFTVASFEKSCRPVRKTGVDALIARMMISLIDLWRC